MYKVLFINCSATGSTGAVISSIATELAKQGNKAVLCVPEVANEFASAAKIHKVSLPYETGLYRRIAYVTGLVYGFAPISTAKLKRIICKEKPDIVHLHCPNGHVANLYHLVSWLKEKEFPVVLTNHCEMFYTANCPHSYDCEKWKTGCGSCDTLREKVGPYWVDRTATSWRKMQRAYSGFQKMAVTSVSQWVHNRAMESPLLGKFPNYLVENGIDTNVFYYRQDAQEQVSEKYGIDSTKPVVLFVAANFTKSKGSAYFTELAKQFENIATFLLVGSTGTETGLPANVINIGRVEGPEELAKLYSIADATLVLSRKETFSMVTAESQCCGTPVVGFLAGGPESIAISEHAKFCAYGDVPALAEALKQQLKKSHNKTQISQLALQKFTNEKMVDAYLRIYQTLLHGDTVNH